MIKSGGFFMDHTYSILWLSQEADLLHLVFYLLFHVQHPNTRWESLILYPAEILKGFDDSVYSKYFPFAGMQRSLQVLL